MINLKLYINKFRRASSRISSILFSRATFCLTIFTLNNIPLLSHASLAACKGLFAQSYLSNSTSPIIVPPSHNFSNFKKNLESLLLTKLLRPDTDLFKNPDNSIKDAFSVEIDHHNQKFHLISLKTPHNYQLINTLKELNLIISLDHIHLNSQNSKFLEQILNESINNGKVVHIENNQNSRLIFSPANLQSNYINNQNAKTKENLVYEIIEVLEQSLSSQSKIQSTKSSEFYLAIALLNAALSPHNKAQTISSIEIEDIFQKNDLINLILTSPHGPELLLKNKISDDNLETLSFNQLAELLQHINNYELEPNSKLRKTSFSISKPSNQSDASYFEKIKIGNLNLNKFILDKFYNAFKDQYPFATDIKSKSQGQLNKISELIKKADLEILVLHEIHSQSIKQFIKDNFDDIYEVHTFNKPHKSFKQQFSTAILIKKSLPIRMNIITHEQINNTELTHPIFEYQFFSKNDPPSSSIPQSIIIAGHLKSLNNNGKSTNEKELALLRSFIESINAKFSNTPILTAFDLNNDLSKKEVRDLAFGNQFKDIRLKDEANNSATHFTIDPRQVNSNPIKLSEIDALFGNKKAQELKLNETLPDELAFLGFLDKNGQLKVPQTIEERESLDFISDHLIIFTFLNPQFLGLPLRN